MKQGDANLQKWILRIMAVVSLPVVPAVIAPHFTVEKLSWLVGFHQPPKTPLLPYLAAGGSFVYLMLSAMLWIISRDVVRYRPLVIFSAWACLVGGPVYWWIDTLTGMPHWWLLMDALSCFIGGIALLWAAGRAKTH
jgi:hypothetical protein